MYWLSNAYPSNKCFLIDWIFLNHFFFLIQLKLTPTRAGRTTYLEMP